MRSNLPVTETEYQLSDSETIVSTTDLDGNITYANPYFVRVSGFTIDELLGAPQNILRHPDMPVEAFADLWRTIRRGQAWTGLVKNRCKNGDFYWVSANVTPVMEAARMIMKSGAKPKRTMLFCAFAGEEFGLLGSTAWVKANKDKLDKISNLFNRDGGPTPPVGLNVPKAMYQDFVKICAPVKKIHPDYPFEVKEAGPFTKPAKPAGTDASVFAVEAVPAIAFNEKDIKGYNFNYGEIWHTERDTYSKSIPEYQEHAATVMAIVTLGVANLEHLLSREGLYK